MTFCSTALPRKKRISRQVPVPAPFLGDRAPGAHQLQHLSATFTGRPWTSRSLTLAPIFAELMSSTGLRLRRPDRSTCATGRLERWKSSASSDRRQWAPLVVFRRKGANPRLPPERCRQTGFRPGGAQRPGPEHCSSSFAILPVFSRFLMVYRCVGHECALRAIAELMPEICLGAGLVA